MSRKDRLLQEIGLLREARKDWFMVLFTMASGIAVLAYAVVSGDKPVSVLILGLIGFVAFLGIAVFYRSIDRKLQAKLQELEKEQETSS